MIHEKKCFLVRLSGIFFFLLTCGFCGFFIGPFSLSCKYISMWKRNLFFSVSQMSSIWERAPLTVKIPLAQVVFLYDSCYFAGEEMSMRMPQVFESILRQFFFNRLLILSITENLTVKTFFPIVADNCTYFLLYLEWICFFLDHITPASNYSCWYWLSFLVWPHSQIESSQFYLRDIRGVYYTCPATKHWKLQN